MDTALLLSNFSRFIELSENNWQLILSRVAIRSFKKGAFITKEGDVNKYTNFIIKGSCRTYYIDENGKEHIIQLAVQDWWIGDYPSFITKEPGRLYTEALEDVETISISYESMQILYQQVPALERFFRLITEQAYVGFQNRILQNLSADAEQRYVEFLQKYPLLDQSIAQKHIASYLGMSAEFLSKIKKRIVNKQK